MIGSARLTKLLHGSGAVTLLRPSLVASQAAAQGADPAVCHRRRHRHAEPASDTQAQLVASRRALSSAGIAASCRPGSPRPSVARRRRRATCRGRRGRLAIQSRSCRAHGRGSGGCQRTWAGRRPGSLGRARRRSTARNECRDRADAGPSCSPRFGPSSIVEPTASQLGLSSSVNGASFSILPLVRPRVSVPSISGWRGRCGSSTRTITPHSGVDSVGAHQAAEQRGGPGAGRDHDGVSITPCQIGIPVMTSALYGESRFWTPHRRRHEPRSDPRYHELRAGAARHLRKRLRRLEWTDRVAGLQHAAPESVGQQRLRGTGFRGVEQRGVSSGNCAVVREQLRAPASSSASSSAPTGVCGIASPRASRRQSDRLIEQRHGGPVVGVLDQAVVAAGGAGGDPDRSRARSPTTPSRARKYAVEQPMMPAPMITTSLSHRPRETTLERVSAAPQANFDPGAIRAFRFTYRSIEPDGTVRLGYALDDIEFEETFELPAPTARLAGRREPARTCCTGSPASATTRPRSRSTSSFETGAPPPATGTAARRRSTPRAWASSRSSTTSSTCRSPQFPRGGRLGERNPCADRSATSRRALLVPVGGGKDSAVAIEIARRQRPRRGAVLGRRRPADPRHAQASRGCRATWSRARSTRACSS